MTNAPADNLPTLTRKERKDLKVLALFTAVYCRTHHGGGSRLEPAERELRGLGLERHRLCGQCRDFLHYALTRRLRCRLDPKPVCKHCRIHCYRPGHRERVREIMRFAGRRLIMRGRFDLLWHYFF